jgi:hypothetical protein
MSAMVHDRCLGVEFLRGAYHVNHGFHLAFEMVTLVNHVGHIGGRAGFPDLVVDLVEDAEDGKDHASALQLAETIECSLCINPLIQ